MKSTGPYGPSRNFDDKRRNLEIWGHDFHLPPNSFEVKAPVTGIIDVVVPDAVCACAVIVSTGPGNDGES